jgi:hypothetical protein
MTLSEKKLNATIMQLQLEVLSLRATVAQLASNSITPQLKALLDEIKAEEPTPPKE